MRPKPRAIEFGAKHRRRPRPSGAKLGLSGGVRSRWLSVGGSARAREARDLWGEESYVTRLVERESPRYR